MSTRVLLCWISSCAFIALTACNSSDTDVIEPTMVQPIARDIGVPPGDASESPTLTIDDTHSGEATYYRATGKGNCSFEASRDSMVAALNSMDYATASMCGAYVAVSGPRGTVTIRIIDQCPACKKNDIDLSKEAFSQIASKGVGRVAITWKIVAGGAVSGPVAYHYKNGSTRYWTAIQVRNHRWPVTTLEILPKGSTDWIRLERRAYNYFVHPKPIPAGPLQVRVTALTGDTLVDELPEPKGGLLVKGAAQFQ